MERDIIYNLYTKLLDESVSLKSYKEKLVQLGYTEKDIDRFRETDPVYNKTAGKRTYIPSLFRWFETGEISLQDLSYIKNELMLWDSLVFKLRGDISKYKNTNQFDKDFIRYSDFKNELLKYRKNNDTISVVSNMWDTLELEKLGIYGEYSYYYVDEYEKVKNILQDVNRYCIKNENNFDAYGGKFIFIVKDQSLVGVLVVSDLTYWDESNHEIVWENMKDYQKEAVFIDKSITKEGLLVLAKDLIDRYKDINVFPRDIINFIYEDEDITVEFVCDLIDVGVDIKDIGGLLERAMGSRHFDVILDKMVEKKISIYDLPRSFVHILAQDADVSFEVFNRMIGKDDEIYMESLPVELIGAIEKDTYLSASLMGFFLDHDIVLDDIPKNIINSAVKTSVGAFLYAKELIFHKKSVPQNIESTLLRNPQYLEEYIEILMRYGQTVSNEVEKLISKDSNLSFIYAKFLTRKGYKVSKQIENSIIKDGDRCLSYARELLYQGKVVPKSVENKLLKDVSLSYRYILTLLDIGKDIQENIINVVGSDNPIVFVVKARDFIRMKKEVPENIVNKILENKYAVFLYAQELMKAGLGVPADIKKILMDSIFKNEFIELSDKYNNL